MSTRLALSRSHHTPFVRLPAERTKMVTMDVLYSHMQIHTCRIHIDAIIKTSEDFFEKIYLSLYWKGSKGLLKVLLWEGAGDRTELQYIDPPTLMAISVVSFSFPKAAQLEARGPSFLLSAGFLYRILSPTGLVSKTGLQTNWLPVFTELYNSSIAHPISPHNWPSGCVISAVLGMAYLIVIERK